MNKSINQIRVELSKIVTGDNPVTNVKTGHLQLYEFFWGDFLRAHKESKNKSTLEVLNYPLMGAFYPNAGLLPRQTQIPLTIYIADKLYKDWSNLNDVESDTLQICRDVFNIINKSTRWNKIGRVQSCSVTKFINRGADEVAGHEMTIQFLIRDSSSICGLPMVDYDFDQVVGDGCSPVQIYENGVLVDTVASGGIYEYSHGDAHYVITNSVGGILYSGDIAENDTLTQAITDSVATLKDTDGVTINTTNILAQGTANIEAPDGSVAVNGNAYDTVVSGGALNIPVVNTVADPVGTIIVGGVLVGNTQIEVNGVNEGSIPAENTLDIQLTDGTNPVVPDSVSLVGDTLTLTLPASEWQRPVDWLAIPSISGGEEVFYGLFAVNNVTLGNFVAFSFAGAYTVDWGDGSALENVATGVTAQHQYDWANVSNVTSEGWRQALIKVTPQAGQNLTNINLQRAHSTVGNGKTSQFMDMVMSLPNVTGANQTIGNGSFVVHRNCQRVWIVDIGAITVGTQMFFNFSSLQSVPIFNTASITLMNAMFNGCVSLKTVPLFNTIAATDMSNMFTSCQYLQEVPLLNTSLVTNMGAMFSGCADLLTVPLLDTSLVTSMNSMFSGCSSLQTLPLFVTTSVTNMSTMFLSCNALQTVPAWNTSAVTNMVNMFNACPSIQVVGFSMGAVTSTTTMFGGTTNSLQKFTATGLTRGISVANQQMSATELNNFFTSLGTAAGAQTITVTGNHGAATCNTAIATAKGFTVVT